MFKSYYKEGMCYACTLAFEARADEGGWELVDKLVSVYFCKFIKIFLDIIIVGKIRKET